MNKKLMIVVGLVGVLLIIASVVSAQGRGNGRCDPQNPDDCIGRPQLNAYNHGGMGFVNPQSGARWNGQQRGQMGRGTGNNGAGFYSAMPPAYQGQLPQDIIDLMLTGWRDEQQAYAIYDSVITNFGDVIPFTNIQFAEEQHISAWEFLFDRYDITVPDVPTFDLPVFDTLAVACTVAADVEIANFSLYDIMLEAFMPYPDIYQVALSLRNASEFNHLPAFQRCEN